MNNKIETEALDNDEKDDEEEEKDIVCNLTEISSKFPARDITETRSIPAAPRPSTQILSRPGSG